MSGILPLRLEFVCTKIHQNRMKQIDLKKVHMLRSLTFNLPPSKKLTTASQALSFVNKRGFIYFWPIKGVNLPSLWTAVAGDRPVADKHDDPGHITWGWKDAALDKKIWYYGKVLRGKATMISLEIVPYFYALSENYGEPEEDYLIAYREGRLSQSARQVYEALLAKGAMHTIDLRRESKLANAKDSEFNKALEFLQRDFKIMPVGVAQAGAWKYSHVFEIVTRHYPDLSERARKITETQARTKLLEMYFKMLGAAQVHDVAMLFGWEKDVLRRAIGVLVESGTLISAEHPKNVGEWFAVKGVI